MKSRLAIAALCAAVWIAGLLGEACADIYVRTDKAGHKEFTNRPSGPGWIFYAREDGFMPVIKFAERGKAKPIDQIIGEIAREFDIDPALVKAIIAVESNHKPDAVSRKGAKGLMQLMPATAKKLKVESPLDPRENIIGGVKYIKGLMAAYGDLSLALAAYNAGPGAVKKYAGIPPYRETINYVKRVLHHYHEYKKGGKVLVADG
ncbi:MAG: lytic transglycosylase domain-containing protein [Deltaproteobacteria bacterium]|nr:lytic transglycosylase domain-containing protein [Deltaproteobacteria bacterium]